MQLYREPVLNVKGEPIAGVVFTVKNSNGELATLFAEDGTPTGNPVTTNLNGEAPFKAANGNYSISVAGLPNQGLQERVIAITLNDPDDAQRFILQTSGFDTFAEALAAASGQQLEINSPVVVSSDTIIPTTTAINVTISGQITVNAGKTLTIKGPFVAGSYRIFQGAGTVLFSASSRSADLAVWRGGYQGAVYAQARLLTQGLADPGGPVHAFEDSNTLNFTYPKADNFNAYASQDVNYTAIGGGAYDHLVGYQARQTYSGSGEITYRFGGFNCLLTHNGTGLVNNLYGMQVENPQGTGTITNLYGILIQQLDRGINSYGIYCATPMNTISVNSGFPATWLLRGNGQTGGFGLLLQSAVNTEAWVMNTANAALKFGSNNLERMRLTPDGLLKIGTTSTVLTDNSLVEVQGLGGITLKATGGAGSGCALNWNSATAGDNLLLGFYTETTATARGSIDYNRTAGSVRYNTTSDATLKNLIGDADLEKSVEIVMSTRLRHYSWKDDQTGKKQMGPLAQELYETFPGAVSVGGMVAEEVDGKMVERYRPWQVDKTAFTFHLIAAYQHQKKLIEDLTARVAALES